MHHDDTDRDAHAEPAAELFAGAASQLFDRGEVESVLSGSFYAPPEPASRRAKKPKAEHYKVICISMYTGDLEQLDGMIDELKRRGLTKANRSALIRFALTQLDLDAVPRGL